MTTQEQLEKIINTEETKCPNNCNEGLIRVYIGTPDEGNMLCKTCDGKGEIEFTTEMKASAILSAGYIKLSDEE